MEKTTITGFFGVFGRVLLRGGGEGVHGWVDNSGYF